jgi:hypothetical protein
MIAVYMLIYIKHLQCSLVHGSLANGIDSFQENNDG